MRYIVIAGTNTYKLNPKYIKIKIVDGIYEDAEAIGVDLSMKIIEENNLVDESKFKDNIRCLEAWMKEEFYLIKEIDFNKIKDYFQMKELTIEEAERLILENEDLQQFFDKI